MFCSISPLNAQYFFHISKNSALNDKSEYNLTGKTASIQLLREKGSHFLSSIKNYNSGELHNKIMNDLLNGRYAGNVDLLGYANAISRAEFGKDLDVDATKVIQLKNNSVAGNPRASLNNYKNAGLGNKNIMTWQNKY